MEATLLKFADKVDWREVITNWNIDRPLEFFSRFQQYIPMSRLQDSRLWKAAQDVKDLVCVEVNFRLLI